MDSTNPNKPIKIRSTDMPDDRDEIRKLRERFEKHLDCHRYDDFEYQERQRRQDEKHEANMKAIETLANAVQPLVDGITVFIVLQKFSKWAGGLAMIGVSISWFTGFNPFR